MFLSTFFVPILISAVARPPGRQPEPITKIVETLANVQSNAEEEHKVDESNYRRTYDWCQHVFNSRKEEYHRQTTEFAELQSKRQVQDALIKQLKDDASQLDEDIKNTKDTIDQATNMRASEHNDYLVEARNFASMLQILNRATDVLSSSTSKQTLVQVTKSLQELASQSPVVSDSQRSALASFAEKAQSTTDSDDVISQSSSVVEVLHGLIGNFQRSAGTAAEQERNALDQYDELIRLKKQSLNELVANKDAKDALLAESLQHSAQVQRTGEDSEGIVKASEVLLQAVQKLCTDKSQEWASRSQSRADFVDGIQHAITALRGDAGSLPAQMSGPPSFLQMGTLQMPAMGQVAGAPPAMNFVLPQQAESSGVQQMPQGQQLQNTQMQAFKNAVGQQGIPTVPLGATNTYSGVTNMVDQMMGQLHAANSDAEKHKSWCDNEIAKTRSTGDAKGSKLQRLATKIDQERSTVKDLESDFTWVDETQKKLKDDFQAIAKLRNEERELYQKTSQNHDMAAQIFRQATVIVQRINALAQQVGPSQGFMQNDRGMQVAPVSQQGADSLTVLQSKLAVVKSASDKAEALAQVDVENFARAIKNMDVIMARAKTYESSLKLETMSGLDGDQEDESALKTQTQQVMDYLHHLRAACADILTHYDERRQRNAQSLQVLQQAKSVINVDNAEQVQGELQKMAVSTDQMAQDLLSTTQPVQAPQPTQAPRLSQLGNSLSDLAMSLDAQPQQTMTQPQQAPLLPQPQPQLVLMQEQVSSAPAPAQSLEAQQQTISSIGASSKSEGTGSILADLQSLQSIAGGQ